MLSWNEPVWFSFSLTVALKSSAVMAAAWLIASILRGRSAAARHLVWTAAAAAVLSLPLLSIGLPGLHLAAADGLLPSASGVVFQVTATAAHRADWPRWIMLLWAAGAAIAFGRMFLALLSIARTRRSARPFPEACLGREFSGALDISRPVAILETRRGAMPMTFGLWRPAVFLPADAVEWTGERRRVVLLHELAHVRRGDAALQLIARAALSLHWWNPLAWMAWREFLKERERAADDMVLNSGARASDYASHLLEVARTMRTAPLASAAVAMARRSQLEGRLRAILDSRVTRRATGRVGAVAAAAAAIAFVAPFAAVRAQTSPDADIAMQAALARKSHAVLMATGAALEVRKDADDDPIYKVGGGVSGPKPVYTPDPQYTEEARAAKCQGVVTLSVVIGKDGVPGEVQVVKGIGCGLDENAVEAVNQWRFTPGAREGEPVRVGAMIEIKFKLL